MTPAVVDIHSHIYTRTYVELLKARTTIPKIVGPLGAERFVIFPEEDTADGSGGRPMGRDFWDVARKLDFMDRHGIDQTVVSLGNPWLDPFDPVQSVTAARDLNAELADLQNDTGGRIVAMGVLPTAVPDAVEVVAEVAEDPGLVGVVTGPRVCGLTLDDEGLEPVWDALARAPGPVAGASAQRCRGGRAEGLRARLPRVDGISVRDDDRHRAGWCSPESSPGIPGCG